MKSEELKSIVIAFILLLLIGIIVFYFIKVETGTPEIKNERKYKVIIE